MIQSFSMKKIYILLLLIFSNIYGDAQNITGEWQGYFVTAGLHNPVRSYFFLDIKQSEKALWGVYNNFTGSSKDNVLGCLCTVTGIIPKGEVSNFDLYKDKIIEHHPKIEQSVCDFVNKLSLHYVVVDNLEYLVGQWYTATNAFVLKDGSSGVFVLKHVSLRPLSLLIKHNIDDYFPKLDKLLERGTTTDTLMLKKFFLLPDDESTLTNQEKDLINALKDKKNN